MQMLTMGQREEEVDALDREVAELLEEGAEYEGYGDRPVSWTVARLCKALDLDPDWDEWAREDWAKDEARAGVSGSPYVSRERGGTGERVLAVRGLQGAGLAQAVRGDGAAVNSSSCPVSEARQGGAIRGAEA